MDGIKISAAGLLLVFVNKLGCGISFFVYLVTGAIKKKLGVCTDSVVLAEF